MSRILLVSYYYPPYPYGGALRFKSLFRHLKEKKHDVKLLTAGKEGYDEREKIIYVEDSFKRDEIKRGRGFLRSINPLPDTMIKWSWNVCMFIENNYDEYDRIVITAPPFSLPMFLSIRHSKEYLSKFILDVRDILYNGALRDYRMFFPKITDKKIERKIFEKFSTFTTNVNHQAHLLHKRYEVNVEVVLNNYDDEYNAKTVDIKHPAFVYTGKIDKIRFNEEMFSGFNEYLKTHEGFIYIAGEDNDSLLKKYLSKNIIYLKTLSREASEDLIYSADGGLMMHSFDIKDSKSVFSYKITDYSKYGKPIIYVGPKTEASKFISEKNIGICVNKKETNKIAEAFVLLYQNRDKFGNSQKYFDKPFINSILDL
jgi:hypothetical protein